MAERGGRAGTVRNILYKDLGSPEEKERLYGSSPTFTGKRA